MYTQEQLDEAIEKAAARGAALVSADIYFIMALDPQHPEYREHRKQRRANVEYLNRVHVGSTKTKKALLMGIFTGVGTFLVTFIWKGWDYLVAAFTSS